MAQEEDYGVNVTMLEINIKKQLASFVFEFNQSIPCEGITTIIGVSGSGKSTLIHLINGLLEPDEGTIILNGDPLVNTYKGIKKPIEKRNIATIFQDPLLFPHLTVKKNLMYGVKSFDESYFNQIVKVLNINHILNRYPVNLSGGEKQRVAIGRGLLSNPSLLLMDEPLSSLDSIRKRELITHIIQSSKQFNIPILFVTHNINEVKLLSDRIAIIEQGKLIDYGTKDEIIDHDYLQNWI